MNAQLKQRIVSDEEFWALVESSNERLEHVGGRVYAMAGGGYTHSRLILRLGSLLDVALRRKKCRPLGSEFFVQIESSGEKLLPDNVVHCEEPRFGSNGLTLLNPIVVFEVLSPATERYDRDDKFDLYARIPSLSDYVLISQNFVRVSHFARQKEGWLMRAFVGLDDVLHLPNIEVEISLRELYDDMDVPLQFILFPQPESGQDPQESR
ncbi:Uma2 family endonuclease [bacterium]|nr:MAG: Uma2 family endonuclease [bacterium]